MKYKKHRSREWRKEKHHMAKKKKLTIMSSVIIVIMISSVFAIMIYGFDAPGTVENYNGYRFTYTQQGLSVNVDGTNYFFEWLPQDVETGNVDSNAATLLRNAQGVTITSEFDSVFSQDIAFAYYLTTEVLANNNKYTMGAYTQETGEIPVATCDDATSTNPVIQYKEAVLLPQVRTEGSCIVVEFDSASDIQRLTHNMLYQYLGIIQ